MENQKIIEKVFQNLMGSGGTTNIKWKGKEKDKGEFEIRSENGKKFSSGQVGFQGKRVELEIRFTNYNQNYLRTKLRNGFQGGRMTAIAITKRQPSAGDVVLVKGYLTAQPNPNTKLPLGTGMKYYAINDDNISCEGEYFPKNMQGILLNHNDKPCPGGPVNKYSRIQIL